MLLFRLSQVGLAKQLAPSAQMFTGLTYFEEVESTRNAAQAEPCGAAQRTASSLGLKEQEKPLGKVQT